MWIDPDQLKLPPKGDVIQYLDRSRYCNLPAKHDAMRVVLSDAENVGPAVQVRSLFNDILIVPLPNQFQEFLPMDGAGPSGE